jgi:hypothetical protein
MPVAGPRCGSILPLTIDKEHAVFLAAPDEGFLAPLVVLAAKPFAVLSAEVDPRFLASTTARAIRA